MMKLNLPEQKAPTVTSNPSNPRKLKKVLSVLPNSNMGELAKQTFHILRDLNRQTMPNKHRLENMEMLRQPANEVIKHLKKYFINRTFPLPEKSQKIINLNQSILQELVFGYEIIAYEAANKIDNKIDEKLLSTAICRAINYLAEVLLHCSEVYEPCTKNLWYDTHQLYLLAENRNLLDKIIVDEERGSVKNTIANSYKQILLFSLARPVSLRQSDSDRVYKELFKWSQYASIHRIAPKSLIGSIFCMRVNEDTAPRYLSEDDFTENTMIRTLDASNLVAHIKNSIAEQSEQDKFAIGDTLSVETLKQLVTSWGENPQRQFSRTEREGYINAVIGLSNICEAIQDSIKQAAANNSKAASAKKQLFNEEIPVDARHEFFQTSNTSTKDSEFTLKSIPADNNDSQLDNMPYVNTSDTEENIWDMVVKGRALTDTYIKEKNHFKDNPFQPHKNNADLYWQIVDISAGGYRLRWNSDNTSKAQIGELIALQKFHVEHDFDWHIGVIRWMQLTQENGLEIGVQTLSPKGAAATVQRASRPHETPFACLMLPDIKTLQLTSSMILPSYAFTKNSNLVVETSENRLNIILGDAREHTGTFTQFSYMKTEPDQLTEKQAKNRDDFDELWASL